MKWEYKIRRFSDYSIMDVVEKMLEEMGNEGWELASSEGLIPSRLSHEMATVALIFKRPKQ